MWLASNSALTQKPPTTSWLTVFACRSSRHSRVVHWIVSCDLLRNQSHYCIIRYLEKKTDNMYANDCFKPNAQFKRFCFLVVSKFLTQQFRKLIDRVVDVIFDILLHSFWCLTDKQNIWFPLCAQSSLHVCIYDDWHGGGRGPFLLITPFLQGWPVSVYEGIKKNKKQALRVSVLV